MVMAEGLHITQNHGAPDYCTVRADPPLEISSFVPVRHDGLPDLHIFTPLAPETSGESSEELEVRFDILPKTVTSSPIPSRK
jgi:hypothetical protein